MCGLLDKSCGQLPRRMSRPPTCLSVLFAVAAWLERERKLSGGYFQQPAQLQASAYAAIRHTTRRTTSFTGTFGTGAFCQDIALEEGFSSIYQRPIYSERDLHRYVQTAVLKVCKGSFAIVAIYYLQKKTTIYMFIRRFIIFCNKSPPK